MKLRTVELSLAGLTEDDQDEHCVDEVIGSCHGRHDLLMAAPVSSARGLNRGLISRLNPRVERARHLYRLGETTATERPQAVSVRPASEYRAGVQARDATRALARHPPVAINKRICFACLSASQRSGSPHARFGRTAALSLNPASRLPDSQARSSRRGAGDSSIPASTS